MKTLVREYKCVQEYLARHKRFNRYTRWELCKRQHLRPTHWFVLSNLCPHGDQV